MKAVVRGFFLACVGMLPMLASATGYQLAIQPAGNRVVISWPTAATNFVLQSTPSLVPPNWQTVTNPVPQITNTTSYVTYTNNTRSQFFRLAFVAPGYSLKLVRSGSAFVISWSTAATNYVLQTTRNLATTNWLTVTNPAPLVTNNLNYVTYTNDWLNRYFRLSLNTNTATTTAYTGMVLIPAGAFTMGNAVGDSDITDANPLSVTVSAFYLDTNLVSYSLWQSVYNLATNAGYGFANGGNGVAATHPVQTLDWYDTVKWCNARSQQAGLTPVYYLDAGFTVVYTNGETDALYANWTANGFRLPTEAEWEKAARGGLSGQRFPWGNTISEAQANYFGDPSGFGGYAYDLGPYNYNSAYYTGPGNTPYTSPVGAFASNGYGLNDMAGNVAEWCWDWYAPYAGGTDPRGPASGQYHVLRGGDWGDDASVARSAERSKDVPASNLAGTYGFRCVRGH